MSRKHKHKRHHGHGRDDGAAHLPRAAGGGASGATALVDGGDGFRLAGYIVAAPPAAGTDGHSEAAEADGGQLAVYLPEGVSPVDIGLAHVTVPQIVTGAAP